MQTELFELNKSKYLLPLGCKEIRVRAISTPYCILDDGTKQHDCITCIYKRTNPHYIQKFLHTTHYINCNCISELIKTEFPELETSNINQVTCEKCLIAYSRR